jgi:hypothetical protein
MFDPMKPAPPVTRNITPARSLEGCFHCINQTGTQPDWRALRVDASLSKAVIAI